MSCVVGIVKNGWVFMGGDSAMSDSYTIMKSGDEKVFRKKKMLFGTVGSPRAKQLLRYSLSIPEKPRSMKDEDYLRTLFIDAVRKCFKDGGFARSNDDEEEGSSFLLACNGVLYEVSKDYQVTKPADQVAAIGSGYEVAYGSLFSSRGLTPQTRIKKALSAAAYYTPYVRAPFVFRRV